MRFTKAAEQIRTALKSDGVLMGDMCLTSKMAQSIELWTALFEDDAPWLNAITQSMGLAPAIASEMARLITLELKSEIDGSGRAKYLNDAYQKVLSHIRQPVEMGCAKGGLVFKPYVSASGIVVQTVQADCFFPVSYDDTGRLIQCVFAEQVFRGADYYTRLEVHTLRKGQLEIKNKAYHSRVAEQLGAEIPLAAIDQWAGLAESVVFGDVDKLPIGYFRVPLANNIDSNSPIGASVYSRAISKIREADRRYSQLNWEFEAKETAVHVADAMLQDNPDGTSAMPKGKERLYRKLKYETGARDKPLLDTYSPDIRDQSYLNGLNSQLRSIEFSCNLAYGTLSDPQSVDKTAEEIKASKQRSYAFVSDAQMALQTALDDLIDAMDFYATLYKLAPAGNYQVSYKWDDSIVMDAEKERQQDLQEVRDGIMQKWEFRAKWYGETEEQAKAAIQAANEAENEGLNFNA